MVADVSFRTAVRNHRREMEGSLSAVVEMPNAANDVVMMLLDK